MFKRNQIQTVDFNKITENMKEGEQAKVMLDQIRRFITDKILENQAAFSREEKKEGEKYYTWGYPFHLIHDDDIEKIAWIVDYKVPEHIVEKRNRDLERAQEWNRNIPEEKN